MTSLYPVTTRSAEPAVTVNSFDVDAMRSTVEEGPRVAAVHVGTAGHRVAWGRLVLVRTADDGAANFSLGGTAA